MSDIYQALARTALLIELDIFGPGADHHAINDGLRDTTARIITDRANIDTPAGQTALVTPYALLAMQGLRIDPDVPATPMRSSQPSLRGTSLPASLLDYSADLLPGGSARPAPAPDVTFALGDTPAPPGAVRVAGTGWTAAAGMAGLGRRWQGDGPAGAMAAAAAAAPEGLRAAVPCSAERLGRAAPRDPRWRTHPGRHAALDLTRYQVDEPVAASDVDVISGGAITSAALYALLRMPAATVSLRIIDPDVLTLPNYNRYALARRSMLCSPKVHAQGPAPIPGPRRSRQRRSGDRQPHRRPGPQGFLPPRRPRRPPHAGARQLTPCRRPALCLGNQAGGEGSQVGDCQVERVRPFRNTFTCAL